MTVEIARELTKEEERVVSFLSDRIKSAESKVARWARDLTDDPAMAFEWAEEVIAAAADLKVVRRVVGIIQEKGIEVARGYALKEAIRGARWPHKSTSAVANATLHEVTAAWADVAQDIGSILDSK